jgi:HAD superfamily hydrolase (TIGR01549 family)
MCPIKLVLFDLDDTLLHFADYWENSVKDAFRNHHFTSEMNSNDLFEVFSNVEQFLVKKLDSKQISFDEYRTKRFLYSMDQMGKTTDVETANNFEMFYQSISKKHMKPNVMINKTIKDLSNYYQIGVLTNGSKGWQNEKLEAIGLDSIIPKEYVFISEVIGYEKPSPEIYHYVLSMTSLPPEQVLVVGDSWTNDVVAPIQEGLKAIWLNKKNYQVPQEPRPLAVITEIEELRAILLSQVGDSPLD